MEMQYFPSYSPIPKKADYGEKKGTRFKGQTILIDENGVLKEVGFPNEEALEEYKKEVEDLKWTVDLLIKLKEKRYSKAKELSDLAYYAHMAQDEQILNLGHHCIKKEFAQFKKKWGWSRVDYPTKLFYKEHYLLLSFKVDEKFSGLLKVNNLKK